MKEKKIWDKCRNSKKFVSVGGLGWDYFQDSWGSVYFLGGMEVETIAVDGKVEITSEVVNIDSILKVVEEEYSAKQGGWDYLRGC